MGILDEAIREHLELKRSHGAEESELDGLQAEAFGPADRPEAVEAETQVISPGSSPTTPAGEGDQLDKVFDATGVAGETKSVDRPAGDESEDPKAAEEAPVAEHAIPAPSEADREEVGPPPEDAIHEADTAETVPPESAEPGAPAAEGAPASDRKADDAEGGDAGDALQRERMTLSGHPTEHYDVDAAIAEEDEIDILSESSLSDELDRALDGPDAAPASEPVPETGASAEPAGPGPDEPVSDEPEPPDEPVSDEFDSVFEDVDKDSSDEVVEEDVDVESETENEGEAEADPAPAEDDPDFFDQEDPLEATPDFLEETPEHDRLWFEQKPPKDFEFGD